ncbi:hypothetical protein E5676_scaffold892G00040 [Cucumis melo var. makuwa]|uniref:Uncharacterized protein n=1 Tax=Cucumis melo var. makuwa TaxID=1194695 RepID=A0A5D3CWC6_CUCMM|nr:hypothetical protein E6C27_scaffold64G002910 [Cucumis melo var. makuwa]TYK15234.1 hypothetical protein E5676_scaffold892G00040 [Cucumis melo var. makuwa]
MRAYSNFDLRTSLLGKRDLAVRTRCANLHPDCLSVSSGYATYQLVLGVPLGHRRLDFVSTRSHVARVRERASSWVGAEVRARASWRATRSDHGEP